MAQQTAINWLRKNLEETYDKEGKLPLAYTFSLLNKAEKMEKEQIVNAHGDKGWAKPIIDENGVPQKDGITFGMTTGEQYYNETYGK